MSFMFEDVLRFIISSNLWLLAGVEVNGCMCLCEIGLELNGGACYSCIKYF